LTSALTIAGAYIAGGFIPLASYIFIPTASTALIISVIVTLIVEALDSACNLKGSCHTRNHVPISLPVKLDLSCLVLHQLGLISTFN
jgi:hypothetical protein